MSLISSRSLVQPQPPHPFFKQSCQSGLKSKLRIIEGSKRQAKLKKEAALEKYYKNPKKCKLCNKILEVPFGIPPSRIRLKTFCNKSCSAIYNNKGVNRHKSLIPKNKNCNYCKRHVDNNKKFCNVFCRKEFYYKNYIIRWKSGKETGLRGKESIHNYIRKYLFIKYKYSCVICSWNRVNLVTNKIPLQVEHKDGNFRNNKERNLTLLCPNCHSLTKTFGNLNRGKGRPGRRKI